MKITVLGIGRMGGALALALSRKGFEIENLVARDAEKARKIAGLIVPQPQILSLDQLDAVSSDAIFITTPDSQIETVARDLAGKLTHRPLVFHASGSRSSESLGALRASGCRVASMHPLVSISDAVRGADSFGNVFFCIEGDDEAAAAGKRIVERLGGKSFSIATKNKTLYHAAAVTACGHVVALVDVALEMLQKCSLEESAARKILLPLIESTVENLSRQTTAEALTGTFARADAETFRNQVEALTENVSPEALEIYVRLGARSLPLAERQGASGEKIAEMQKIIRLAKKNFEC